MPGSVQQLMCKHTWEPQLHVCMQCFCGGRTANLSLSCKYAVLWLLQLWVLVVGCWVVGWLSRLPHMAHALATVHGHVSTCALG
jgi:hypothetical protein